MKLAFLCLLALLSPFLTGPIQAQPSKPYVELQGIYLRSNTTNQYQTGALIGWPIIGPLTVGVEAQMADRAWTLFEHDRTERNVVYTGIWTGASVLLRNRWVLGGRWQVGPEWVNTQLSSNPPGLEAELITDKRVRAFFGLQTHGGIALTESRNLYLLGHINWLRLNSDPPPAVGEEGTLVELFRSPAQLEIRLSIGWNFGR
ncbi:MAG: hypothetical protein AAFQ98_04225 [Bacteroidota bacterium]